MKNNSTNSNLHLQSSGTSLRTINATACNSTVNQSNFSQIRKLNPNMIQTTHRSSLNFSSTNTINRSANRDIFSNSYNFPTRDSIQMSTLKFRRSESITAYFPQEINSTVNSVITTIEPTIITGTFNNNNNITAANSLRSKFKSNFSPYHSKRHKSNQLTMIDYCNIINLNTNFQMLTNYLESDDPCSKLAMKSNRNGNIQKQTSIAEQMSILFGSTMCNCYLCKMKLAKNAKRHQRHHFEIIPSRNNMDYSIMRYTYSSPYSQLSTLKLFNILNTDCSIHFSTETNSNKINLNGSSSNVNSFNLTNTTISNTNPTSITNSNTQSVACSATTYPLYSYNPFTTTIIAAASASNVSNQSSSNLNNTTNNNNSSNVLTLKNLMHVNPNSPPLYESRYLYLIDCRLNKKHFKKHHIYTSIHYSDLLNDTVYLSPPTDNYTLIVLYDENGRILTNSNGLTSPSSLSVSTSVLNSNNASRLSNQTFSNDDMLELDTMIVKGDEIIKSIRAKLNCVPNQTMYILSGGYEEFYSKFPFMCSDIDIRSTVDRNKYLTIYPNCVIENQIYIGSGIQAKNWKIIRDLNITHIINCSIEHECVFQEELAYLHVRLEDNHQENIHKFMVKTLRFIEDAFDKYYEEVYKSENSTDFSIDSGINSATSSKSSNLTNNNSNNSKPIRTPIFLIHCNLGISRSSSILIGYLISKYKLCLYSAFKYVKDKRLQIAPNYSFLKQLKQFEDTVI